MKIKIAKKSPDCLEEINAMSAGNVEGYGAPFGDPETIKRFNKDQEKDQRLKGHKLEEMFSSAGIKGNVFKLRISGEKEHAGHVERSNAQGLKNVMESNEDTIKDMTLEPSDTLGSVDLSDKSFDKNYEKENRLPLPAELEEELKRHGLEVVNAVDDYLGGGKFGKVYRAFTIEEDFEGALKIISGSPSEIQREVRNYTKISQARSADPLIEKHFPEVYEAWIAKINNKDTGFIFMEVLKPVNKETKKMLAGGSYWKANKNTGFDRKSRELGQEISVRAELFFKRDNEVLKSLPKRVFDMAKDKKVMPNISIRKVRPSNFKILEQLADSPRAQSELDGKIKFAEQLAAKEGLSKSLDKLKFLLDDYDKSMFAKLALTETFNALAAVATGKVVNNTMWISADQSVLDTLVDIQREIRTSTIAKGHYDVKSVVNNYKNENRSDIERAIEAVVAKTRLFGRDLHWNNYMERENGDLVIVDLGMFKTSRELRAGKKRRRKAKPIKESRNYSIKILTNRRK